MGKCRFVTPNTVRLELSDGDWIEVKSQLTYGEEKRLSSAGMRYKDQSGEGFSLDLERYNIERLSAWITDWSFDDADGKRVGVSNGAIWALDPDAAREIELALTTHIKAVESSKNARKPGRKSGPKSPSSDG